MIDGTEMFRLVGLTEPNLEQPWSTLWEVFCTLSLSRYFEILQQIKNDNVVSQLDLQAHIAENMFKKQNLLISIFGQQHSITLRHSFHLVGAHSNNKNTLQESGQFFNCTAPGLFFGIALKISPPC